MDFDPLNVMILVRKPNRPDRASRASRYRLFGNPDDAFAQTLPKRRLITQSEVRLITVAQLDIRQTSVARLMPGGRMAVNVATIDGLATAHETLKKLAGEVQLWNVMIARGIEQLDRTRFESINPTYLLAVTKTSEAGD